jgi:hypothetical protein
MMRRRSANTWGDRKHWEIFLGAVRVHRWCAGAPCHLTSTSRHPVRMTLRRHTPPGFPLDGPISDRIRGGTSMARKTRFFGRESGNGPGGPQYLAPQTPYTGDGKTKRTIFDKVTVIFKKANEK